MRISEGQKDVLKIIGTVTMVTAAALFAPNLVQLLKPKDKNKKRSYKRSIQKLLDNKIIYLFGEEIKLTQKGQELFKKISIEDINIPKGDEWNKVWHLVCYDVPENKKRQRDYFKNKLLKSGFWAIQDSLWVYPWDCKEEIAVIAQNLGISTNVAYLNTDYLPGQEKLLKRFGLDES